MAIHFDPTRAGLDLSTHGDECGETACDADHAHGHSEVFSTWSYETEDPVALEPLREALRKLPGTVSRVKGFINAAEESSRRTVLQVVGRRVDLSRQDEWGSRTPRTQIVAIGSATDIDRHMLERAFASCVLTRTSVMPAPQGLVGTADRLSTIPVTSPIAVGRDAERRSA